MTSPTSIQPAVPVDLGLHGHKLEAFVKKITEYKGRLDAALVATANGKATMEQRAWLLEEGFVREEPRGKGVTTDTFAAWTLGPFRIDAPYQADRSISMFPGWAAIGWNRRQYGKVSRAEALAIKKAIDNDTLNPDVSDGFAAWLKPLPVIVTGEGKHRADLHRHHEMDMLARIRVVEFPAAGELELVPIRWTTGEWALRCLDMTRIARTERIRGGLAYLPLPQLSVPLLKAYGVKTSSRKCWPWQVSLGLRDAPRNAPIGLQLRPGKWRHVVLTEGYI